MGVIVKILRKIRAGGYPIAAERGKVGRRLHGNAKGGAECAIRPERHAGTAMKREKGKIPHSEWSTIQARYSAGESFASIARDYGCTGPAIRYIVNRMPIPSDSVGADVAVAEAGSLVAMPEAGERPDAPGARGEADMVRRRRPKGHAMIQENRPAAQPASGAPGGVNAELLERVSSTVASFLAIFDLYLNDPSTEFEEQLLDATDRLMRVAARTRIELERARAEPGKAGARNQ